MSNKSKRAREGDREYPAEFRSGAVAVVLDEDRPIARCELGSHFGSVAEHLLKLPRQLNVTGEAVQQPGHETLSEAGVVVSHIAQPQRRLYTAIPMLMATTCCCGPRRNSPCPHDGVDTRAIVLDNEAVQALADAFHAKHRTVVAHLQGAVDRRRRGRSIDVMVPTAVRVEAGWDRSRSSAAALNRFRVRDRELDAASANVAASIVSSEVVESIADAHIGASAHELATDDIVVFTSEPKDIIAVCAPRSVRVVTI